MCRCDRLGCKPKYLLGRQHREEASKTIIQIIRFSDPIGLPQCDILLCQPKVSRLFWGASNFPGLCTIILSSVAHLDPASTAVLGAGFVSNVISTSAATTDSTTYNHFAASDGSDIVFTIRGDGQVRGDSRRDDGDGISDSSSPM